MDELDDVQVDDNYERGWQFIYDLAEQHWAEVDADFERKYGHLI